jgi:hypothetical protein
LFSFEWDTRVEKTVMQTLASQLSSTLMQLLFSFEWDMRVEKTVMQTLTSQLSSRHFLIPWTGRAFAPLGPFLCPTTEEEKWPIAPKPGP